MKTFLIVSLAWLFFCMFIFPLFLTKQERRRMDRFFQKQRDKKSGSTITFTEEQYKKYKRQQEKDTLRSLRLSRSDRERVKVNGTTVTMPEDVYRRYKKKMESNQLFSGVEGYEIYV